MNSNNSMTRAWWATHPRTSTVALGLAAVAAVSLAIPNVVLAQEDDEGSDYKRSSEIFEEIVVTAVPRGDESQFDSSVTVTTLGAGDIGGSVPRSTA